MACWVVPTIAAEFWKVSVQQVLDCVKLGTVPTKMELGFLLVDVLPGAPEIAEPARAVSAPTFEAITREEETALLADPFTPEHAQIQAAREEEEPADQIWVDEEDPTMGRVDFGCWRQKRREIARTRQAPKALAA